MSAPEAARAAAAVRDAPVLLYDGECGFCARSVQFLLRHEGPRHTLRFAPLQGALGAEVRRRHPEIADVDSVVWLEPEREGEERERRVLVRSRAVLRAAAYLGGVWKLLGALGRVVPRPLGDAAYDLVARNRFRIAGWSAACLLPTPEQRERFIEL